MAWLQGAVMALSLIGSRQMTQGSRGFCGGRDTGRFSCPDMHSRGVFLVLVVDSAYFHGGD